MEDLLGKGVRLFNSGHYWEAHEAWEQAWIPDRRGPDRGFWKGLIQVAAGCLHCTRHNRRGALNKLRGGVAYLAPYLPAHRNIQLAPLVAAVEGLIAQVEHGEWPAELPQVELLDS